MQTTTAVGEDPNSPPRSTGHCNALGRGTWDDREHQEREERNPTIRRYRNRSFHLAGKALSMVPEVTYMGISLSQMGISDTKLKKAKIAVYKLRKLGMFKKGLSAEKCIKLCKSLIQPRWEYARPPHPTDASCARQRSERSSKHSSFKFSAR